MLASLQQPYPKGEVFIGHRDGDFSVSMGCSDNCNTQGYVFTLHTPERDFILSAETREDMNQWICALQRVTDLPMTPQDNRRTYIYAYLFSLIPLPSSNPPFYTCVLKCNQLWVVCVFYLDMLCEKLLTKVN